MLNIKKTFAILLVATFLAEIPIAVSASFQGPVSVTYKVEVVDYYGKPPGTPGVGKPSGDAKPPSGYSLLGFKWKSLGLTLVINPGSEEFEIGFKTAIEAAAETWVQLWLCVGLCFAEWIYESLRLSTDRQRLTVNYQKHKSIDIAKPIYKVDF